MLHRERDYQVTMEDYRGWETALKDNQYARLISYPGLNHLFMPGTGNQNPQEYIKENNVDQQVIEDIAGWILNNN